MEALPPPTCRDEVIAGILMHLPMTLERESVRKRQPRCGFTSETTLIPALPDDVVVSILVRLPRSNWFNLRLVSKAWRKTIEDPCFYESRLDLNLTEEWCYTETWHPKTKLVQWSAFDFDHGKWRGLPPVPKKRGLDPEIFGRASTSLRGELYVVGGKAGVSGPTLREMYIYSPFTLRWRKGKSMIKTRHSAVIFPIFERKIYVMGGFDCFNNVVVTGECYDADTGEWELVGNEEYPEVVCPGWYHVGWQVQWAPFCFNGDEHYLSYRTKKSEQVAKYYVPRLGTWMVAGHRAKVKALMRYSLGAVVNKHIVMLDWATGRLRYTHYPGRNIVWATVRGMADLNWVTIFGYNPKVSSMGSKFVLVGRGLRLWTIETDLILLKAEDGNFIESFPAVPGGPDLEPIGCVTVAA